MFICSGVAVPSSQPLYSAAAAEKYTALQIQGILLAFDPAIEGVSGWTSLCDLQSITYVVEGLIF